MLTAHLGNLTAISNIFAIGDTALVIAHSRNLIGLKNATAQPMPGLAQPAIQEGKYVANLIGRRVKKPIATRTLLVLG
jgi:NADH dehydrogenase FAD-containing subunit